MGTLNSDYDPYLYREIEQPLNNLETFVNLFKSFLGSGLLAMPMAFHNAGWVLGLMGTAFITMMLIYSMQLLIHGIYYACRWERVPELIYSEAMGVAFREGPPCLRAGKVAVVYLTDFFLGFFHFGICSIYVVFIADNTKEVADFYITEMDARIYMAILILPLIAIFSIRDLKHLVPFSALANIFIIVGIAVVLYYVFVDLGPLSERQTFQPIKYLPLFFGTVLFSMEAPGVVVALESNMAKPRAYLGVCGILSIGMVLVAVLYAFMGFFGYWRYGADIEGSITLNLSDTDILSQVVKCFFALAIYFSYPLQGYITIDILTHRYIFKRVRKERHRQVEYMLRFAMVLLSVICGVSIPQLGLFLSLIGSMCLSVLGLMFPALMDVCVRYQTSYGPLKIYLLQDIFIFTFGLIGCVSGTGVAIKEIITTYT